MGKNVSIRNTSVTFDNQKNVMFAQSNKAFAAMIIAGMVSTSLATRRVTVNQSKDSDASNDKMWMTEYYEGPWMFHDNQTDERIQFETEEQLQDHLRGQPEPLHADHMLKNLREGRRFGWQTVNSWVERRAIDQPDYQYA